MDHLAAVRVGICSASKVDNFVNAAHKIEWMNFHKTTIVIIMPQKLYPWIGTLSRSNLSTFYHGTLADFPNWVE